jgi:crooked neck
MFAKFEIRRLELVSARKILGTAIGMCPKEAIFKGYIDLEVEVSGVQSEVHILTVILNFYLAS